LQSVKQRFFALLLIIRRHLGFRMPHDLQRPLPVEIRVRVHVRRMGGFMPRFCPGHVQPDEGRLPAAFFRLLSSLLIR
jgi:hypothetical protein